MGIDDMETEFFGSSRRSSRPKRSDRLRAKREQRRQLQPLKSSDPGERAGAASSMVEQGIDSSATVLLDFVRDERNSDVRRAVAQAVLTAPVGAHPDRPEAQLRDWALAEVTRHGDPPPPASTPSPPPPEGAAPEEAAAAPAPLAFSPAPSSAPSAPIVCGTIPASLSPDDRWRTGGADPVRPRSAPAARRPASRPAPPPPPAAPTPPVVGGTVGNGTKPDAAAAPDERDPEKVDEKQVAGTEQPAKKEASAENPAKQEAGTEKPEKLEAGTEKKDAAAAQPAPPPSVPVSDGEPDRPATWRVIKAHPVDIIVWEPADGEPETAQPSGAAAR